MITAVGDATVTRAAEPVTQEETHETVVDMPQLNAVRTQILAVFYFVITSTLLIVLRCMTDDASVCCVYYQIVKFHLILFWLHDVSCDHHCQLFCTSSIGNLVLLKVLFMCLL